MCSSSDMSAVNPLARRKFFSHVSARRTTSPAGWWTSTVCDPGLSSLATTREQRERKLVGLASWEGRLASQPVEPRLPSAPRSVPRLRLQSRLRLWL